MGKLEKTLKKFASKPKLVNKEEVITVLERFGFELDFNRGSHIVVRHIKLLDQPEFGCRGEFTVPTTNGRFIKGFYLKRILIAIDIVTEDD